MVSAYHEAFLVQRTAGIKHGKRAFYVHLKGVHDLLRDWGNCEEVCLAGLFHSIYGTQYFKHGVLDREDVVDRMELNGLIGLHAAHLVLRFCSEERKTMTDPQLLEIEAANLLEQGAVKAAARLLDKPIS